MSITLNKTNLSLPNRTRFKLTASEPVTWTSNNDLVKVFSDGTVLAMEDAIRPDCQAVITATAVGGETATCNVTVVNWVANQTNLEIERVVPSFSYITQLSDGRTVATRWNELFESDNQFESMVKIATLPKPAAQQPILETPFGYFYRSNVEGEPDKIYQSDNLVDWTLSYTADLGYLINAHNFCTYHDQVSNVSYIFMSEYTGSPGNLSNRHKVHRGTISSRGAEWNVVLEFDSENQYNSNKEMYNFFASHIHFVMTDEYTGHVWVGTGDTDAGCRMLYSTDFGETFKVLGQGSQQWRSLAVWFTEKYIYWNMDTHLPQSIWRIPRTSYNPSTETYPEITAESNDYRERVAFLNQGSLWYVTKLKGSNTFIIGGAAEGQIRDWNARVFAMKENPNGSVQVRELMVLPSANPSQYIWESRIEPIAQDDNGYLYFRGFATNLSGLIVAKPLIWVDAYMSPPLVWLKNEDLNFVSPF